MRRQARSARRESKTTITRIISAAPAASAANSALKKFFTASVRFAAARGARDPVGGCRLGGSRQLRAPSSSAAARSAREARLDARDDRARARARDFAHRPHFDEAAAFDQSREK